MKFELSGFPHYMLHRCYCGSSRFRRPQYSKDKRVRKKGSKAPKDGYRNMCQTCGQTYYTLVKLSRRNAWQVGFLMDGFVDGMGYHRLSRAMTRGNRLGLVPRRLRIAMDKIASMMYYGARLTGIFTDDMLCRLYYGDEWHIDETCVMPR